ncbi:MAG TPA: NAD-dependent epimerase [Steroidobacteraceae bacterium]|nr:NAD-dependent epimerase [Steroidobacteraceae bacterium]
MKLLVTGAAGFIGCDTALALLARGDEVVGLDNLNPYYDPALKAARLARLTPRPGFRFEMIDLADRAAMAALFARERFDRVVHLGAQAGVRHSVDHPHTYLESNLSGFLNVLEGCRAGHIEHLVYASTSSVYGANTHMPFAETQGTAHPLSLYAATKKANELMAHSHASIHGLPVTGLRFFTVYGPWGRPDMALFRFTRAILAGQPIEVFNDGRHKRDFTYIDDIVRGVLAAVDRIAAPDPGWNADAPDPSTSRVPYRIYNIGNQRAVPLLRYIEVLEECLGRKAQKIFLPLQAGDVPETAADITLIARDLGFRPSTPIEVGVRRFVDWYLQHYREPRSG